ncbi:NYN domain-containing protein [Agromyces aerolatus]|uniref:NYN domain-containing protein n=1 Tax=Agromyces sp. LY-1074 TaxID=3074080 RepID=UPI0028674684|nr:MULTISPECIES: NYN domain-containing protein [unclassified Agromyces]MDR5700562.1 NYN domain-containing protein [Agromyces sp. LY-1074]MDR5707083.1 NYN domain-containing protein [Agromyces sp. LY-1358]
MATSAAPTQAEPRVALYFDFDNIVISRYDQLHGDGSYRRNLARGKAPAAGTQTAARLLEATVDIDAVLDFAATFGTIALARAYADWSTPVNASYRGQLIDRAVDLVQLFPLVASMKNGADIRLAVDAVEDLFRLDDLTHIVIVAGDSDYVPLAQKAKRLGRYVVGIGVAGGTSRALAAACDEFADYDALLTTDASVDEDEVPAEIPTRAARGRQRRADASTAADGEASPEASVADEPSVADRTVAASPTPPSRNPGRLLLKSLELLRAKNDQEWQPTGAVKSQMQRMDPSFQERKLGFGSFTDFVRSRAGAIELDEAGNRIRVHPKKN